MRGDLPAPGRFRQARARVGSPAERFMAGVWAPGRLPLPLPPLMCGIVGYVGDRPCRDLLIAGLEKLEYRGYDSAGVSVISDGEIDSVRAVGNLANLREAARRAILERRRRRRGGSAPGDDRARAHAVGDPRPGHRGERPPPRRLRGQDPHRPQRDHREPRGAAAGPEGRGSRVHLGDRRRDRQPT